MGLHHATCVYEFIIYDTISAAFNKKLYFEYENGEYRTNGVNDLLPVTYIFLV